ncbi:MULTISPECIES: SRPBCC family protein [Niastella]|uniref:SRPBCC family protein n=1 Tax=Niastella soli TaxID=2821487 RepID=A0ABS3Z1U9_9BACT|nr:SRPBCC family protein [Niastella soli]MBO9204136.1 SRPBCC family protein [Niastella soli]
MLDVSTEIIINLPKEKVAEFASDPANAPSWCAHIKSVEWNNEAPLRAGAKLVVNEKLMRRRQQLVYEVLEIIPGQKMIMQTSSNGMHMETTVGWQAINENTTCMTLRNRGIPAAFAPFLKLAIRNVNRRNLKQLKKMLELSYRRLVVL